MMHIESVDQVGIIIEARAFRRSKEGQMKHFMGVCKKLRVSFGALDAIQN